MSENLIKSKQVYRMCGGIHAMTLSRWMKQKGFPAPYMVVGRIRYWRERDVQEWLDSNGSKK